MICQEEHERTIDSSVDDFTEWLAFQVNANFASRVPMAELGSRSPSE